MTRTFGLTGLIFAFGVSGCSGSDSGSNTTSTTTGGTSSAGTTSTGGSTSGSGGVLGSGGSTGGSSGTTSGGSGGSGMIVPVGEVPPAMWVNVTNNLAGMASECGNAAAIFASPWYDMLVTGVARNGLFASTDGAATWNPIGAGGPGTILNRMTGIVFDPVTQDQFWEAGIYGWESPWSEGVFVTKDNGMSFTGFPNMGAQAQSSNDSVSIDFTDPDRKTMLSGGHEQGVDGGQGLFLCKDGSGTFTDIMPSLPAGMGFCTSTLVVDANTLLVGCANSYKGETPGIVRSTDAGATWGSVSATGGSGQPLLATDGSIYWSAAGGGMLKSTDQGATFTQVADASKTGGMPPFELPDGRIVSTTMSGVVVSADGGTTWTSATTAIPFSPNGLTYSAHRRAFYASHFDCSNNVPGDAHAVYGWDYNAN